MQQDKGLVLKKRGILQSQKALAILIVVILFVFFSIFGTKFLTLDMMENILQSSYFIICIALGMTFIITSGGIDLSISAVMLTAAITAGVAYNNWGWPIGYALLLIPAITAIFGTLNGFLVAYCKLPAFIATMGSMMMAQGVSYIISDLTTMRFPPISDLENGWYKWVFYKTQTGFPVAIFYIIGLVLIAFYLMNKTKFGKYTAAIGSNKEATRLSGVNVQKWEMLVYIVSSLFAAMGSIFFICVYNAIIPGTSGGYELNAIAATVIGGTSLAGGEGTITGTVIGVFIINILKVGLVTVGLQQQWQIFFTGLVLVLAVLMDIYRSEKAKKVVKSM